MMLNNVFQSSYNQDLAHRFTNLTYPVYTVEKKRFKRFHRFAALQTMSVEVLLGKDLVVGKLIPIGYIVLVRAKGHLRQ